MNEEMIVNYIIVQGVHKKVFFSFAKRTLFFGHHVLYNVMKYHYDNNVLAVSIILSNVV